MPLLIDNAILHTITNDPATTLFSDIGLDVDSETCTEFVGRHVRRLLHNPGAKEATFSEGSSVYALIKAFQKGELRFIELSRLLCERLAQLMQSGADIPPADVLVTLFDNAGKTYLALLKLNFTECYTHCVEQTESGTGTRLIKNLTVLPQGAGKVEEACLIPYDPMVLRVFEKPHALGGEQVDYFSSLFLECETNISKKEAAEQLLQVADAVGERHFGGDVEKQAQRKRAIIEEAGAAEEEGGEEPLRVGRVAERLFPAPEQEAVREEFIAAAREQGLPEELPIDRSFAERAYKTQVVRADNGVEIRCPAELFSDPTAVVMENHADGSFTITFKNLRRQEK